jgi:hypothetical protein
LKRRIGSQDLSTNDKDRVLELDQETSSLDK